MATGSGNFKKLKILLPTLIGWSFLLYLWYKMMFSKDGMHLSFIAFRNIGLFTAFLVILYFFWSSFNVEKFIVQSIFNKHFIRYKTKTFPWVEITYDEGDQIVNWKNRSEIICSQKEQKLSTTKKLSYSAILIRDGCIKEAIGYLRQIQYDPNACQLAQKIADSEMDLLFHEINIISN